VGKTVKNNGGGLIGGPAGITVAPSKSSTATGKKNSLIAGRGDCGKECRCSGEISRHGKKGGKGLKRRSQKERLKREGVLKRGEKRR